MTLYRIANWHANFDHRDTAQAEGPLKWIKVPTKTDGFGFGLLRQEKNAPELLAAWYLMLGVAAKQPKASRGDLSRDGIPLTSEDLALMTGFPKRIFDSALAFFSQPKQGWLVAQVCEKSQTFAKNATRQEESRVEKNRVDGGSAAVAAPASDSDWLAELSRNPAYAHVRVATEHAKFLVWCQTNRRQATRRRFVAWLNRIEPPMRPQTSQILPRQADLPEPDGWRAWVNENTPQAVYARGMPEEGKAWVELDRVVQEYITKQLKRSA